MGTRRFKPSPVPGTRLVREGRLPGRVPSDLRKGQHRERLSIFDYVGKRLIQDHVLAYF
jgi:hypothetical protein